MYQINDGVCVVRKSDIKRVYKDEKGEKFGWWKDKNGQIHLEGRGNEPSPDRNSKQPDLSYSEPPIRTKNPIEQILLLSLRELRRSNPSIRMVSGEYSYERKTLGVITFNFSGYLKGILGEFGIVVEEEVSNDRISRGDFRPSQKYKSVMAAVFKDIDQRKITQLK